MSNCTLTNDSFVGKVPGDPYLDTDFRCRSCGKLAADHPPPAQPAAIPGDFLKQEDLRSIRNSLRTIEQVGNSIAILTPILARTNARLFNPYRADVVTASSIKSQRTVFAGCLKIPREFDEDPSIYDYLALTQTEHANSPRNILFLSKNIETAFDKCRISFVPKDELHTSTLVLTINDPTVGEELIYDGADPACKISKFAGSPLQLNGHTPFMRCLSYQAYIAYTTFLSASCKPIEYGTPGTPFRDLRTMEESLARSFKEELVCEGFMYEEEDDADIGK